MGADDLQKLCCVKLENQNQSFCLLSDEATVLLFLKSFHKPSFRGPKAAILTWKPPTESRPYPGTPSESRLCILWWIF
jgi:hypothetical protein